uniref:Uncharacterized protein n=1 Tax=Arundo donax TaxID=35708 RepID=A0A0A9GLE0_ARUDO
MSVCVFCCLKILSICFCILHLSNECNLLINEFH